MYRICFVEAFKEDQFNATNCYHNEFEQKMLENGEHYTVTRIRLKTDRPKEGRFLGGRIVINFKVTRQT